MSTTSNDDDLANDSTIITDRPSSNELENPLYALHKAIAAMPDIDADRVAAVLKKLQNGTIDILGDATQRANAESRIAARIMEESLGVDITPKTKG